MPSIINASSTGSGGIVQTADASGVLQLQSNGTLALNVDTSANVLVNGTLTTAKLAVANNTNDGTSNTRQYAVFGTATTYLDSDASNLWGSGLGEFQIQNGTATRPAMLSMGGSVNTDEGMGVINFFRSGNDDSYRARVQIAGVVGSTGTAGRHGGYLSIRVAADGQTDPAQVVRFNPSGTVILKDADASATGTGITFPATQSASTNANTLDDYEEGTFSPVIQSDTTGQFTMTTQYGRYTRVGNLVTFVAYVEWSSRPSGGSVTLANYPFNINNGGTTGGNAATAFVVKSATDSVLTNANLSFDGTGPNSTTYAYNFARSALIAVNSTSSAGFVSFSGSYFATN
jgi:hypothetical protein